MSAAVNNTHLELDAFLGHQSAGRQRKKLMPGKVGILFLAWFCQQLMEVFLLLWLRSETSK